MVYDTQERLEAEARPQHGLLREHGLLMEFLQVYQERDFTLRHQGGGLGIFLFVAIRELYSSFGGCILYFICFLLLRVTSQSAGKAPSAHGVGCC